MGLSSEERERQSLRVREVRKKCKITQEEAAHLLGIAKNTWVRWECGAFRVDELMLELLPYLSKNKRPSLCSGFRRKTFDNALMADHIRTCHDCWLAIKYLSTVSKKPPKKKSAY